MKKQFSFNDNLIAPIVLIILTLLIGFNSFVILNPEFEEQ